MSESLNLKNGHGVKERFVTGKNSEGVAFRGALLKMSRFSVVFEFYNPMVVLRFSESLDDFKITFNDRELYSGKATIRTIIHTDVSAVTCEATLNEDSWGGMDFDAVKKLPGQWRAEYQGFLREWQKTYQVSPEYKLIVADMQAYFTDLRLWLGQVELGVRSKSVEDRAALEREIAWDMADSTLQTCTSLFEKFEAATRHIPENLIPTYQNYAVRQLHPLLLCSPFLYRCFFKPLGYAGDYEMVNMILRDPLEGATLYAKIVNLWFIGQPPAEAHRNRIDYLKRQILKATAKAASEGRKARIMSLGCGPAQEVQQFLEEYDTCERTHFSLLDFSAVTLDYTRSVIGEIKRKHFRTTQCEFIKKSVQGIIKESALGTVAKEERYDFVYCAGLFDYLSDEVCQRLMNVMYGWVTPGGLLVSTNVDPSNSRRLTMEYIMAWHLIYRNGPQLGALLPVDARPEFCSVKADITGVNVFCEVNKPPHD